MVRIAALFLAFFSLLPISQADVPPEVLREELAEFMTLFGLDEPVVADSEEYQSTLADPWLGYRVIVLVDKSAQGTSPTAQTLFVFTHNSKTNNFQHFASWKTSTGLESTYYKDGKAVSSRVTPVGFYRVEYMQRDYVSFKYGEPMPYSLFYWRNYGVAIHATSEARYKHLGSRASMGCTRLTLENARELYEMVDAYGRQAVGKLDRLTGLLMQSKDGPLVLRSYPLFVLNTAPGHTTAQIQIDPAEYVQRPDALIELLQAGR